MADPEFTRLSLRPVVLSAAELRAAAAVTLERALSDMVREAAEHLQQQVSRDLRTLMLYGDRNGTICKGHFGKLPEVEV